MNTLMKTACQRCREQKLKCSRELPQCARCLKFDIACAYPAPPDRKMLATLRAPPERRRPRQNILRQTAHRYASQQSSANTARYSSPPDEATRPDDGLMAAPDIEISPQAHDFLQEIYFTCQFHSTLLFHRPTFFRAFEEGHVNQHVLLAMYANSTIFLPETSPIYRQNARLLRPLGDLKQLGRRWALCAGRNILQDIDQPTFTGVQVCEMLALYWFSEGDSQRHAMFLSIAYKAATLLGLDSKSGHAPLPDLHSIVDQAWLSAEIARRCFWAVWFTQCINSDNQLTDIVFSDQVMNLPLPISESSFLRSRPERTLRSLSLMHDTPTNAADTDALAKPSILSELMGIMFYWAKIRKLLESRKRKSSSAWLTDVFEMDARLSRWRCRLPESFQYTKRTLNDQLVANQQSLYVLMHAVHRQCRLVLHASLVPQFSGLDLPGGIPPEVTSVSARIAWSSAEDISRLANDLLAMDWDPAKIPAFVGYCLYASASVHIAVLAVGDPALTNRAKAHLASTLKLLKSLKPYWSVLNKLWTRINILYVTQMQNLQSPAIGTQPTAEPLRHGSTQSEVKDLDQIASQVRDSSQLAEPLADSVLEYSLRHLETAQEGASRLVQTSMEAETEPESQLEELMMEEIPHASLSTGNGFGLSEERMEVNMGHPVTEPRIEADGDFFEPIQLFDTAQENGSSMSAWDMWGLTFSNPRQPNYDFFGLGGDL